jgi:hypothetical protein
MKGSFMRLRGDGGGVCFSRIGSVVSIAAVSQFCSDFFERVDVGDLVDLLCLVVVVVVAAHKNKWLMRRS